MLSRVLSMLPLLPPNARYLIASMSIVFAVMDAALTLITLSAFSSVISTAILFVTVLYGILPVLRVPASVSALVACIVSFIAAIGVLTPWALCKWLPRQEGLCGCVDDKAVLRLMMLTVAVVLACFVHYARKYE